MDEQNRLGKNIRSLRIAFGETQEELGLVIHVEKATVSQYETGKRIPNNLVLQAIAEHYVVSVEELTSLDLSGIGKITVDPFAFCRNIDTVLPIAVSDQALSNGSFKKAYQLHIECFERIKKLDPDCFDRMDSCMEY